MHPKVAAIAALALVVVLAAPAAVLASSPPANDDWANAAPIGSLPFADDVDTTAATIESSEPGGCGYNTYDSIWYSFTPSADALVRLSQAGSSFDYGEIDLFRADGPTMADLTEITCSAWGAPAQATLQGGSTYYFRAADMGNGGGTLHFTAIEVLPPSNDDFGDAKAITSLPFSDSTDLSAATLQGPEPSPSCANSSSGQSAWYVYHPSASRSVSASFDAYGAILGEYRGTTLGGLTEVGCGNWYNTLSTIHVNAGSTYYFQVFSAFQPVGITGFQLVVAPDPSANFNYYPPDPSTFDAIQFGSDGNDPANVGLSTFAWTFGDGGTASVGGTSHTYKADGDYTVRLTTGTPDGRSATTSQVVHVRTHDVSLVKLVVPVSANAGQARQITVNVGSKRYAERAQVDLYRSSPQGWVLVGSLTHDVAAKAANKTTSYPFNYVFTKEDAAAGKVTFRAVATIQGSRDAYLSDNEQVATTRVMR